MGGVGGIMVLDGPVYYGGRKTKSEGLFSVQYRNHLAVSLM